MSDTAIEIAAARGTTTTSRLSNTVIEQSTLSLNLSKSTGQCQQLQVQPIDENFAFVYLQTHAMQVVNEVVFGKSEREATGDRRHHSRVSSKPPAIVQHTSRDRRSDEDRSVLNQQISSEFCNFNLQIEEQISRQLHLRAALSDIRVDVVDGRLNFHQIIGRRVPVILQEVFDLLGQVIDVEGH